MFDVITIHLNGRPARLPRWGCCINWEIGAQLSFVSVDSLVVIDIRVLLVLGTQCDRQHSREQRRRGTGSSPLLQNKSQLSNLLSEKQISNHWIRKDCVQVFPVKIEL